MYSFKTFKNGLKKLFYKELSNTCYRLFGYLKYTFSGVFECITRISEHVHGNATGE